MEIFTKKIFLLACFLFQLVEKALKVNGNKVAKKCLNSWFKASIHFDLKGGLVFFSFSFIDQLTVHLLSFM